MFWRRWRPLNKTPQYGSRSFFKRNDAFWPRDSGMTWHDLNVHLTLAWTNAWAVGGNLSNLTGTKTKPFGKMRSQLDLPTDPNGDWRTTLLLWLAKHEMLIFISRRKVVWKSYWFFSLWRKKLPTKWGFFIPGFMNRQTKNNENRFWIEQHVTSRSTSAGFRACHGTSLPSSASSLVILMIHFRQAAPGKKMKVASSIWVLRAETVEVHPKKKTAQCTTVFFYSSDIKRL